MPLKQGDHVDRYEIVDLIGEGGMGEVYRAYDTRLQRSVALKLLRPLPPSEESSTASGGAARILREARLAASLEHPNIVAVYDVGEVQEPAEARGTAFLAMELVRGRSLRAYVGDESIPLGERVRWLGDIASALGAAHDKGLVHRDVKPENVMVRDDGTIKVLDFGVAKRTFVAVGRNSSTEAHILSTLSAGGVVGTPYYMAPEQLRNEALDGRADQFAWGVMAYELLTGHGPWGIEGGGLQLVAEILSKTPPTLGNVRADVSPELAAAVMRALARAPGDRFASMHDLIDALATIPDAFAQTAAVIRVSDRDVTGDSPSSRDVSPHGPTMAAPSSGMTKQPPRRVTASVRSPKSSEAPPAASAPATKRRAIWIAGTIALAVGAVIAARARWERSTDHAPVVVASSARPSHAGCASNAECVRANDGKPFICSKADGACLSLASDDCTPSAEPRDLENDETVWIGTMFPLTGSDASWGKREAQAVELARRDFSSAMGGFTMQDGGARVRPIALVQCDDRADADRAARHLVESARVPAIIGFSSGTKLIELAGSRLLPNGVLVIASLSVNPLITAIPEPSEHSRLLWRTAYNAAATAAPVSQLIEEILEPKIRREAPVPAGEPIRVAVLRSKSDVVQAQQFVATVRFNGKSGVENASNYRDIVFDTDDLSNDAALSTLRQFSPHVIAVYPHDAAMRNVIRPLEDGWTARHRPTYVAFTVLGAASFDVIGASEQRRRRFFGLAPVSNTTANAQFALHFNATYSSNLSRTEVPSSSYDAFYMLGYAVYGVADSAVTGASLSSGIVRLLPPGTPVDVGPAHIFDGFTALRAGKSIDLTGAVGSLDYERGTGDPPTDFTVLCVARATTNGGRLEEVESGLVFDARAKKLVGALRCR